MKDQINQETFQEFLLTAHFRGLFHNMAHLFEKEPGLEKWLCYLGQICLAQVFIFSFFYATSRQDLMKKNHTVRQYQAVSFSTFFSTYIHHYLRTTNYYQMDRNLFTVRRQYHATLANFLLHIFTIFLKTYIFILLRNIVHFPFN